MKTIQDLVNECGITITTDYHGVITWLSKDMDVFAFTASVERDRKTIEFEYYQGLGLSRSTGKKVPVTRPRQPPKRLVEMGALEPIEPTSADILRAIIHPETDSTFYEWCEEFGLDNDSIKALDAYNGCKFLNGEARELLGDKYREFVETLRSSAPE